MQRQYEKQTGTRGQSRDRSSYRGERDSRDEHYGEGRDTDYSNRSGRDFQGGGSRSFQEHSQEPSGKNFSGRGPKGYKRSDDRIREDVCERLSEDPSIDASEIEVSVSDCEVTLSGTVNERRVKRMAEDIAEDVSGVKDVHNEIRVQADTDRSESTSRLSSEGKEAKNRQPSGQSSVAH